MRERYKKELEAKHQEQVGVFNENQRQLRFLPKDKNKWEEKMEDVKANAK